MPKTRVPYSPEFRRLLLNGGLPASYPMVAINYASRRSELAKKIGLGRKPAQPATAKVPVRKVAAGVSGRKRGGKEGVAAEMGAPPIK